MLADDLDERNIRPDFKANQMAHMRRVLDNQINNYHTDSEVKNKSKTLDYGPNFDNNDPVFENPLTYAVPPGAPSVIPGMIPPAPFPPLAGALPIPGVPPFAGGPIPGVLPHPFAGPFAPPFGMPGHPIGKFQ